MPHPKKGKDGFLELALSVAEGQGGVLSDKTARELTEFTHQGMVRSFGLRMHD
jgi:hypothetical protein